MKKLIIGGILITVAVVFLLIILLKNNSPFGRNNSSFAAEPKKEITSIELSDGITKLVFKKEGETWLLNGKTEIRKSSIYFIIRVLTEIKIKSPVSSQLFDSEIKSKGIVPVKVRVYEKRKLIKSFQVYKTTSNVYGNIMKIKDNSKPFIVYMPGYDGNIGASFILNELFWQPYTIFNLLPSEIESIDFENLSDTANSFSVISRNHEYIITDRNRELTGSDSALVARYLSYFIRIPFESWALELGMEEQEMIEGSEPLYRITVMEVKGTKRVLLLWGRSIIENDIKKTDSDRMFGKTEESKTLFVIRYFDIDPILKKRSYFFPR